MAEAVLSYPQTKRVEWVLDWPGQVVLAGDLIYWTSEVTQVWEMLDHNSFRAKVWATFTVCYCVYMVCQHLYNILKPQG